VPLCARSRRIVRLTVVLLLMVFFCNALLGCTVLWAFGYNLLTVPVAAGLLFPFWSFSLPPAAAGALASSKLARPVSQVFRGCLLQVSARSCHPCPLWSSPCCWEDTDPPRPLLPGFLSNCERFKLLQYRTSLRIPVWYLIRHVTRDRVACGPQSQCEQAQGEHEHRENGTRKRALRKHGDDGDTGTGQQSLRVACHGSAWSAPQTQRSVSCSKRTELRPSRGICGIYSLYCSI
jgi:hypothetical protein